MEDVSQPNLSGGLLAQILGVFYMICGGMYCLTCIGAIFGVPWFLLGLALFRGGGHAKAYQVSGDETDALQTADELMRYVRIQAILALIGALLGFVMTVVYMLMVVFVVAAEM